MTGPRTAVLLSIPPTPAVGRVAGSGERSAHTFPIRSGAWPTRHQGWKDSSEAVFCCPPPNLVENRSLTELFARRGTVPGLCTAL